MLDTKRIRQAKLFLFALAASLLLHNSPVLAQPELTSRLDCNEVVTIVRELAESGDPTLLTYHRQHSI